MSLEDLQGLDHATKTKIMIVGTIVIMVLVLYFWLAYFNTLIATTAAPEAAPVAANATVTTNTPTQDGDASVWTHTAGTMAFIYGAFAGLVHNIENIFTGAREYSVQPQN